MTTNQPRSIVTYVHRQKRPPGNKAQAAAITGPAIVTAKSTLPDMPPEEHKRRRRCRRCSVPRDGAPGDRQAGARRLMPARPAPRRHWRIYGNDPLPSGAEALDEPLRAFPSWFLRIVCERCGKGADDLRIRKRRHVRRGTASGAVKWPWDGPAGAVSVLLLAECFRTVNVGMAVSGSPEPPREAPSFRVAFVAFRTIYFAVPTVLPVLPVL
jgi:hypothetical protein